MSSPKENEACGRCSFSTVVDAVESTNEDDDGSARDPFAGDRIELDERELRIANAPALLAGRVKRRLDEVAHRFVYE